MYEKGLGTEASAPKAVALYKEAIANGSIEAQRALDRLAADTGNR
jgi:TPR repeat protein